MVELIAVIVIMGVLAAVAGPRFFDRGTFDSRGFYDQVLSSLRYAQKEAIAQHRYICVGFTSSSVTLTFDTTPPDATTHPTATCPGSALASPTGDSNYTINNTSGVTLSAFTNFYFDALGRPSVAPQTISVSGYTSGPITIERETGYVH